MLRTGALEVHAVFDGLIYIYLYKSESLEVPSFSESSSLHLPSTCD